MNKKRNFKLVLIGDDKVGKTSFVRALIGDQTMPIQSQIAPVQLPSDMFQNPDCTTVIFDTSNTKQGQLPKEVYYEYKQVFDSDVILLMYDISSYNSAERLRGFWLKELYAKDCKVFSILIKQPIIIVGNKLDILDEIQEDENEEEPQRIFKVIKPLVKEYNRVEMGIECSAITRKGLHDVINCAQRSFLYPLSPIYNFANRSLTIPFKKALTRIFRIGDKDQDGYWNDQELKRFQKKVFHRQLDEYDIQGIKDMIEEEIKEKQPRINLDGFIALQKRGVELMKIQICWTILRHFNYTDGLVIENSQLENEILIDSAAGQVVELSEHAISFLKYLFKLFDKTRIEQQDLDFIFYPVMIDNNFPQINCLHGNHIDIDQTQWLSLWCAYTYFNYQEAYKIMKYIGYDATISDAFHETNKKNSWSSVSKLNERKVYSLVFVVHPSRKQIVLNSLFDNKSISIFNYHRKTYICRLQDLAEAEAISVKQSLSKVDYLIINDNLHFNTEYPVPTLKDNLEGATTLLQYIERISNILHSNSLGYSDLQIRALKEQNEVSWWTIIAGATVLTTVALLGVAVYHKKIK